MLRGDYMNSLMALRKSKGLTQEELGKKVGVQAQSISKWERGISNPNSRHVKALANALGVSGSDIFLLFFSN
jgi:transcriptional regulator with XRE-family HTH domain